MPPRSPETTHATRAALLAGLAACATPSIDLPPSTPALPGVTFDADGQPGPLPDDFLLSYAQSGCFGWCPDFEVTIDRDGAGAYLGHWCVNVAGPVATRVAPDDLRDVVAALGALRFAELDERYEALEPWLWWSSDSPSATVTVRSGGVETTVSDYWGYGELLLPATLGPLGTWQSAPLPDWLHRLRVLEGYVYDVTGVDRSIGYPQAVPDCGI